MKIAAKPQPSTTTLYGEAKADIWGEQRFARHDASAWWSDGGVSDGIADDVKAKVKTAIIENVRDAMIENIKDGWFELAVQNGSIHIVFDMSAGDSAPLMAHVKLTDVLASAIADAKDGGEAGAKFRAALADDLDEVAAGIRKTHNRPPEEVEPVSRKMRRPATSTGDDIAEPDVMAAMGGRRR